MTRSALLVEEIGAVGKTAGGSGICARLAPTPAAVRAAIAASHEPGKSFRSGMSSHSDVFFCFTPHHRPMFDFMMAEGLANNSSELRVNRRAAK